MSISRFYLRKSVFQCHSLPTRALSTPPASSMTSCGQAGGIRGPSRVRSKEAQKHIGLPRTNDTWTGTGQSKCYQLMTIKLSTLPNKRLRTPLHIFIKRSTLDIYVVSYFALKHKLIWFLLDTMKAVFSCLFLALVCVTLAEGGRLQHHVEDSLYCWATNGWANRAGMDTWCQDNCGMPDPNCPMSTRDGGGCDCNCDEGDDGCPRKWTMAHRCGLTTVYFV